MGVLLGLLGESLLIWREALALVVIIVSILFYTLAALLAGSLKRGLWAGYLHMATSITWLSLGLSSALLVVIVGTLLAEFLRAFNHPRGPGAFVDDPTSHPFREITGRIAINGNSALIAHGVYVWLGGSLPLASLNETPQLLAALVALVASLSATQVIGRALMRLSTPEKGPHHPSVHSQTALLEGMLIVVTLVLPPIFYQMGVLTFLVLIGLMAVQTVRYHQLSVTRRTLTQRVRELTTLNSVGQKISANLLLDNVLQSIHQELEQLVKARNFTIALYDHRLHRIDYPLALRDGQRVNLASHPPGDGPTDYVMRHKRSLLLYQHEPERLQHLGIDPPSLDAACYLGVPLLVGERLIGALAIADPLNPQALGLDDLKVMETIASQASLAIRNGSLYKRQVNLANDLALLNHSVQDVMFNLDKDEALRAACNIARDMTDANQVAVYLFEPALQRQPRLAHAVGVDEAGREALQAIQYDIWLEAYKQGTRTITDAHQTDEPLRSIAQTIGFRATAEVPMRSGNTIMGLLTVYHEQRHHYHETEINLLEMLANQITAALDNAELLQALEVYASEQAQLVHLSRISTSDLELERVIGDVCLLMAQMMDMQDVEIGLYQMGRQRFRLYRHEGSHLVNDEMPLRDVPEFAQLMREVVSTPRLYLREHENVSSALRARMAQRQQAMTIALPMIINHEAFGLITISAPETRWLTDNDRRLLEMATHQVAAQIHNAQIHTSTEAALIQRLEQLSLIEDIAQQISRSLDLAPIINNVLEAALKSTQADIAGIALLDDEANVFRVMMQRVVEGETEHYEVVRPVDQGVIGYVARTGSAVVCGDNRELSYYVPPTDGVEQKPIVYQSTLAVPMLKNQVVIGVLNCESYQRDFFMDEQAGFLTSLAGHAVISIDNARLLDERQEQIRALTLLRQLAMETAFTTERETMVHKILHTTSQILEGHAAALYHHLPEDDAFQLVGAINAPETGLMIPEQLLRESTRQRQAVFLTQLDEQPLYQHNGTHPDYRSLAIIPIFRGDKVQDAVVVTFRETRHFKRQDHNTLDLLTAQIAGHLENIALNEAIRTSNDRMRAILDSTRDGVLLLDRQGRVQHCNPAVERLLDVAFSASMGQPLGFILDTHPALRATFDQGEGPRPYEAAMLASDAVHEREYVLDNLTYLKEISYPVQDVHGGITGRLLILRDITEEKALAAYREKIRSMILHDLRGPLGSVISSMHLGIAIIKDPGDMSIEETLIPTLEVSLESADNLLQLVDSLRDIPKLERGAFPIETAPTSAREVAEKAYQTLGATLREAEHKVILDIDEALMLQVDPNLVRRVYINLIHNAYKFTPIGGTLLIATDRRAPAGFARTLICDTGPGIPAEMRERIFNEFEQIQGQRPSRGGKGSGLGLTYCKLAVEAHGGRIWVENDGPLSGACFAFTLPLVSSLEGVQPV